MMNRLFGVVAAAFLVGCASSGADRKASTANRSGDPPIMAQTEAPDLGAINGFGIPAGRCGMILYAQSGAKTVPVFRSTDDGQGLMSVDGAIRPLTLVGRGGETRQNVPSRQFFRAEPSSQGQGLGVAIQTRWGSSFPSGAYVRDGTLTITGADGWSRVLPVAGIAGCKA